VITFGLAGSFMIAVGYTLGRYVPAVLVWLPLFLVGCVAAGTFPVRRTRVWARRFETLTGIWMLVSYTALAVLALWRPA
jgi:hypothetical protein